MFERNYTTLQGCMQPGYRSISGHAGYHVVNSLCVIGVY